jgi:hypothetical protein
MGQTKPLPEFNQGALFFTPSSPRNPVVRDGGRRFVDPDRSKIFVGAGRLEVYLRENGMDDAIALAKALDGMDWSAFEAKYAPSGRPPYHLETDVRDRGVRHLAGIQLPAKS